MEISLEQYNKMAERLTELEYLLAERQWIPCSERLPNELEVVNVTWVNHEPVPYYESIKDVPFTASAVYYRGKWYWYSSITVDVLAEYGKYESEEFDDAIECIAWMPLPGPYRGESRWISKNSISLNCGDYFCIAKKSACTTTRKTTLASQKNVQRVVMVR